MANEAISDFPNYNPMTDTTIVPSIDPTGDPGYGAAPNKVISGLTIKQYIFSSVSLTVDGVTIVSPYQIPDTIGGQVPGYIDVDNTSGAACVLLLPLDPVVGQRMVFTDMGGNAGTHSITIKDGATTMAVLEDDGACVCIRWNGTVWLESL